MDVPTYARPIFITDAVFNVSRGLEEKATSSRTP